MQLQNPESELIFPRSSHGRGRGRGGDNGGQNKITKIEIEKMGEKSIRGNNQGREKRGGSGDGGDGEGLRMMSDERELLYY